MKTVYKYRLPEGGLGVVSMPKDAKRLHLGLDPCGDLCLWAEVDTAAESEMWMIVAMGTGWPLDEVSDMEYWGTINDGCCYMWHYYGKKMEENDGWEKE